LLDGVVMVAANIVTGWSYFKL